ncbi:MAG TPA: hypothetical protein VLV28_09090 [Gaiellaceae bacterium]|nr:hypothetical protein [Gaiellaceae bacterium]
MQVRLIVEDDSYFHEEDLDVLDPAEIELDEEDVARALASTPAASLGDIYRTGEPRPDARARPQRSP